MSTPGRQGQQGEDRPMEQKNGDANKPKGQSVHRGDSYPQSISNVTFNTAQCRAIGNRAGTPKDLGRAAATRRVTTQCLERKDLILCMNIIVLFQRIKWYGRIPILIFSEIVFILWVKSSSFLWVRSSSFFGLGRLHFYKY